MCVYVEVWAGWGGGYCRCGHADLHGQPGAGRPCRRRPVLTKLGGHKAREGGAARRAPYWPLSAPCRPVRARRGRGWAACGPVQAAPASTLPRRIGGARTCGPLDPRRQAVHPPPAVVAHSDLHPAAVRDGGLAVGPCGSGARCGGAAGGWCSSLASAPSQLPPCTGRQRFMPRAQRRAAARLAGVEQRLRSWRAAPTGTCGPGHLCGVP